MLDNGDGDSQGDSQGDWEALAKEGWKSDSRIESSVDVGEVTSSACEPSV